MTTTEAIETRPAVVSLDGMCALPRTLIGGKAWSIDRMRALGLPVPPAFTITTACCADFYAHGRVLSEQIWQQVLRGIAVLEEGTGRTFGAANRPLLVSVRSGAAVSMPGMMDTVLNLGMNADVERALAAESGSAAYARDTRRRFVSQYREVVLGDVSAEVTDDPWAQLRAAIATVFDSWESPRARTYRRNRGVDDALGTAVTVQAMVFGNLDSASGTGVVFSRNPNTGERVVWGEWLPRGQGEDVVSGRTTPEPLDRLAASQPLAHAQLLDAARLLEHDGRDIQDIEFTVESGRLWLLQARAAKRSPRAAVRAAVAMVDEGLISEAEAVRRVTAEQVRLLLQPALSGSEVAEGTPVAAGEPACPGLASGIAVTDPDEAEKRGVAGADVVLVRSTTSPDDLHGMIGARAIVTEHGGSTSHAAVVSREIGRPCVVGCGEGTVARLAGHEVTVDGSTGKVWLGRVSGTAVEEAADADLTRIADWAAPLVPVTVYRAAEYRADLTCGVEPVRLDDAGDHWRQALPSARGVCGAVLETDEGIHAATAAGVDFVVVEQKLPALLAALNAPAPRREPDEPSGTLIEACVVSDLPVLRLVAIKGRATPEAVAASLGVNADDVRRRCEALTAAGDCLATPAGLRITPAGRARMATLLDQERAGLDADALAEAYDEFCTYNQELKEIITAWQMRDARTPNDHTDPQYDAGVLSRLDGLHVRVVPLLGHLGSLVPWLGRYTNRLDLAHRKINNGEHNWVARPIMDSYHTVWFELHEDLIALRGLTRAAEAASGREQ